MVACANARTSSRRQRTKGPAHGNDFTQVSSARYPLLTACARLCIQGCRNAYVTVHRCRPSTRDDTWCDAQEQRALGKIVKKGANRSNSSLGAGLQGERGGRQRRLQQRGGVGLPAGGPLPNRVGGRHAEGVRRAGGERVDARARAGAPPGLPPGAPLLRDLHPAHGARSGRAPRAWGHAPPHLHDDVMLGFE